MSPRTLLQDTDQLNDIAPEGNTTPYRRILILLNMKAGCMPLFTHPACERQQDRSTIKVASEIRRLRRNSRRSFERNTNTNPRIESLGIVPKVQNRPPVSRDFHPLRLAFAGYRYFVSPSPVMSNHSGTRTLCRLTRRRTGKI